MSNIKYNDYYVYVYKRPDDGTPFYIGKGRGKRWKQHLSDKGEKSFNKRMNGKVRNLIEAGTPPIIEKVAENLSENEAYQLETKLIMKYGRIGYDEDGVLMNHMTEGKAPKLCGVNHPNYGKVWSREQRDKLSKSRTGIPSPKRGIPLTNEQKLKISETKLARGQSEAQKLALIETHQKIKGFKQSDHQKDIVRKIKQKEYIITWPDGKEEYVLNLSEWCDIHNMPNGKSNLFSVATGKLKAYKGFKARYP